MLGVLLRGSRRERIAVVGLLGFVQLSEAFWVGIGSILAQSHLLGPVVGSRNMPLATLFSKPKKNERKPMLCNFYQRLITPHVLRFDFFFRFVLRIQFF